MDEKINNEIEWEFAGKPEISCLNIDIEFENITKEQAIMLEQLTDAWASVGSLGGYKGVMHNASKVIKISDSYNMLVDLGSADPEVALDILREMLITFSRYEGVIIKKMLLGKTDL